MRKTLIIPAVAFLSMTVLSLSTYNGVKGNLPLAQAHPADGTSHSTITPVSYNPARPVFKDGQAQIVPEFSDTSKWIRETLWVETSFDSDGDGVPDRVFVDVTRPRQTETEGLKVPVIYESSPYYAGIAPGKEFFWDVNHELETTPPTRGAAPAIPYVSRKTRISNSHVNTWVPRGFAVVHSEAPGTGLSDGCSPMGASHEALAPKAVIDWLNGRATGFRSSTGRDTVSANWSTGNVGMIGTSYNGTLALAAATTGVEGLKAIVPIAPLTSYYHYYRSFGLVRNPGGYPGEDMDVLYDAVNSGNPALRQHCDSILRDGELLKNLDRATGDYNDFWDGRDYLHGVKNIRAAVLMAHAFNDWNVMPEHSVRIYDSLKSLGVPHLIYFHQGGHGGPPPLDMMNRWFTRFLFDVDNGIEKGDKSWIVREGVRQNRPTPYSDYPHQDADDVIFSLLRGGNSHGTLSLVKHCSQGTENIEDDATLSARQLATMDSSAGRLLYLTEPLSAPLHISGWSKVKMAVASNKKAANLSVYLVALPWTNESIITRGWADPRNHASLRESEDLAPNVFYDLSFTLQPDDQIIPTGSRLGVMIFSSDKDFTLLPQKGTALQVDLDKVRITIPVVGGREAAEKAIGTIPLTKEKQ